MSGRTLVIQPLPGIGDMVWHLPHLHAIAEHAPDKKITVLTKPRSRADVLLKADPAVEQVLWLHRPGTHDGLRGFMRLARDLRRLRFHTAWLLHGSRRYALVLRLAGIPVRLMNPRGLRGHPIDLADALCQLQGLTLDRARCHVCLDPLAGAAIEARSGKLPAPWIAFGIGSSEAYKQWGAARFAELAECVLQHVRVQIFLLGGANERALAAEIIQRLTTPASESVIAVTDLSLDQSAALIARSKAYVGNDTGALNLAAALHRPALGLFGASPPLSHSPYLQVIQPAVANSGMAGISVAQVRDALSSHLSGVAYR